MHFSVDGVLVLGACSCYGWMSANILGTESGWSCIAVGVLDKVRKDGNGMRFIAYACMEMEEDAFAHVNMDGRLDIMLQHAVSKNYT